MFGGPARRAARQINPGTESKGVARAWPAVAPLCFSETRRALGSCNGALQLSRLIDFAESCLSSDSNTFNFFHSPGSHTSYRYPRPCRQGTGICASLQFSSKDKTASCGLISADSNLADHGDRRRVYATSGAQDRDHCPIADNTIGIADASEALTISLVQPRESGLQKLESFNPAFTYAIFGEEERIFGYKGLKINLSFNASDMRPNLSVASTKKFQTLGEAEAFDIVGTLKEYLPGGMCHLLICVLTTNTDLAQSHSRTRRISRPPPMHFPQDGHHPASLSRRSSATARPTKSGRVTLPSKASSSW